MPAFDIQNAIGLLEQGRTDEAIPLLQHLIDTAPVYVTAYVLLARAYEAEQQWRHALDVWHRAQFLMPNSPSIAEGAARAARQMTAPTWFPRVEREPAPPPAPPPAAPEEQATPPPEAPAPEVAAPEVVIPEVPAPEEAAPEAFAPDEAAPEAAAPVASAPEEEATDWTPPYEPVLDVHLPPEDVVPLEDPEPADDFVPPEEAVDVAVPEPVGEAWGPAEALPEPEEEPDEDYGLQWLDAAGEGEEDQARDAAGAPGPVGWNEPMPPEEEDDFVDLTEAPEAPPLAPGPEPSGRAAPPWRYLEPEADVEPAAEPEAEPGVEPEAEPDVDLEGAPAPSALPRTPPGFADLDRLIDELESARIVPRPDLDQIPPPELEDDIEDMVSETLARIYASQQQFDEAARVYELLSAQQPERADEFLRKATEMRARAADH